MIFLGLGVGYLLGALIYFLILESRGDGKDFIKDTKLSTKNWFKIKE